MSLLENKNPSETKAGEVGVLEFCVGENSYGIDVMQVRELLQYRPMQSIPNAQAYVEGVICPRSELLTVIDLAGYLNHPHSVKPEKDTYVVVIFNQMPIAFHVHRVIGIHRIPWEAVEKPSSAVFGGGEGMVTGIAKLGGKLISLLDLGKIMGDVNPCSSEAV